MDQIGFAERLAYLRWLLNRGRLEALKDSELAERLRVHPKWLAKWKGRPDAPPGRAEAVAISEAIAPWGASVDWLYDGVGEPPEPDQWKGWYAQYLAQRPLPVMKNRSVLPAKTARRKRPGSS